MGCVWGHGYHGSWFLRWNLEHRLFIKEHFGINTCGRQGAQPCIGTGSKLSCHGSQYRLLSIFWGSVELEWPSKVVLSWFLSLVLFMWCIMFIDLQILYHPCIPGMNPTWSWCMIFLMYCWMRFANILLRILASMFISNIGLQFSFFVMSFPVFIPLLLIIQLPWILYTLGNIMQDMFEYSYVAISAHYFLKINS